MLLALWTVSLGLAGAALVLMGALIIVRLLRNRAAAQTTRARRELTEALIEWLEQTVIGSERIIALARRRPTLFRELLIETCELVRGVERERLLRLGEDLGIPQVLERTLRRGRVRGRRDAAEQLGLFVSPAVFDALRAALQDPTAEVRLAAARALAEHGQPIPVGDIARTAGDRAPSRLVHELFKRLAAVQADDLVALLLDESAPMDARVAALDALSGTGDYRLLPIVAALGDSASPDLRATTARALGALGHPYSESTLARLLEDPSWYVRAAAAEAAGAIGLVALRPRLLALLHDEKWWVRLRAGRALAAMGEEGRRALEEAARIPSGDVAARTASLILAEQGAA